MTAQLLGGINTKERKLKKRRRKEATSLCPLVCTSLICSFWTYLMFSAVGTALKNAKSPAERKFIVEDRLGICHPQKSMTS
jgi:hypothetical protein